MAPVEGTTEDSEVFIRLEAEKDRLGAADLAGAVTQRVVQPAGPRTAGGCIEHPLRSSVGFSCQRKRRSTAMSGLCQTFTSVASLFSEKFGVFFNYFSEVA